MRTCVFQCLVRVLMAGGCGKANGVPRFASLRLCERRDAVLVSF